VAGHIPKTFIDDLLARVDIVDVIEQHLALRKQGRDYQALCPFHDEKTPSFTVSRQKQFFYCFGCGASGSAIGFLMDYAHMAFPDAVAELAGRVGLRLPAGQAETAHTASAAPLYDHLAAAQRYFARQLRAHSAAAQAIEYLKRRGLSGAITAAFGIGYAPPGWDNLLRALGSDPATIAALAEAGLLVARDGGHYDRFRDRIMFPIHDHRGRVVGFGGRVLGDGEPKYLNSPETPVFHKGRELYGLHRARQCGAAARRLLVVEGYMDVVALAQHGIDNAVATLGTATTGEHLERLFRATPHIVFCFDGDPAGERAAWRALEAALPLLRDGRSVGFLFMPAGEDPDSWVRKAGPEPFQDEEAPRPLLEFLFERLSAQVNLATVDGRVRLGQLLEPLRALVPPGALQELMAQRLGDLTGYRPAAPRARAAPRQAPPARRAPSLVRTAINLLLHCPELATRVGDPATLRQAGLPGVDLLADLLEYLHAQPQASIGALLEHWRETPFATHLQRLLASEPPIPPAGYADEFTGALEKIRRIAEKSTIDHKVVKLRPSELSAAEKAELRARFASRRGDTEQD